MATKRFIIILEDDNTTAVDALRLVLLHTARSFATAQPAQLDEPVDVTLVEETITDLQVAYADVLRESPDILETLGEQENAD